MFCHDRYSLLCSERINDTIVSTQARKRWERQNGFTSQVIACTLIEHAMPRQGKDGFHLPLVWPIGQHRRGVRSSCWRVHLAGRVLLHLPRTVSLLVFSLSAVSRRRGLWCRRAGSMRLSHSRRRAAERCCLMRDTRGTEARMRTSVSLVEQETGWSYQHTGIDVKTSQRTSDYFTSIPAER